MARVMKDTTVATTAALLLQTCGPSWVSDSYEHWSAIVKAWALGKTRSLPDDDRWALISQIQNLDEALMAERRALNEDDEDEEDEEDD
jgi:hypothetical protein